MLLIPLFPLELVVFPREQLNLHIFEPRYRQLIQDCQSEDITFGIPFYREAYPLAYGCIVRLKKIVNTYDDGRMDISTEGLKPFEIKRYVKTFPKKLYPGGYIEERYWDKDGEPNLYKDIKDRIAHLYEYMNIAKLPAAFDGPFISFDIAHKIGMDVTQEYELLQIPGEPERQTYIIAHLDRMVPMALEMERMRKKIQMNGHFKNIIPPNV